MKRLFYSLGLMVALTVVFTACKKNQDTVTPQEQDADLKAANSCVKIQDGTLVYPANHYLEGEPLETGFDIFGYNYQARIFNGLYANIYLGRDGFPPYEGDDDTYLADNPAAENHWAWPYRNDDVMMKWNDAWISNKDCDGDGSLDRHNGFDTYSGSGAWLTNHISGTYMVDGNDCDRNYFTKIIAAPADAYTDNGYWYNADGTEIGPVIWGAFATIQTVENDPCAGLNGMQYNSPDHSGLGDWGSTPTCEPAFFQGFETDYEGWFENGGTISVGGGQAVFIGDAPFTRFDGYSDTWTGTWSAEIDVYLDPNWTNGQGFDYSVAANGTDNAHQRDFIFHVSKDISDNVLYVGASNNSNSSARQDLETINHYEVTSAGWYTLQHVFRDNEGVLAVDLNLLGSNGDVLFTETRSDVADLIPGVVGGNRYGWFVFNTIDGGITVDNTKLFRGCN